MGIEWPDPGPGTTRVPLGEAGTEALSQSLRAG
jgi:hypothetical protein